MLSWDHMDSVLRARSMDDVKSATARFVRAQGFSHHGYAARFQDGANAAGQDYVWFEDFGNEWSKTYPLLATPRFERSDARILQARAGLPAAAWNSRGESSYTPPARIMSQVRRTLQMAGEFGVHGGVTVPSWAPGMDWSFMTFAFDATCDPREMTPTIPAAVYYVSCLQATLNRLLSRPQPLAHLSARECEVLRWCAIGKTSWEISAILRISERTVNFHLQRIADRLGVKGRRAACARAVALGLITL